MGGAWKRVVAFTQDRPVGVSVVLVGLVAVHALAAIWWPRLSPWVSYSKPAPDAIGTIASVYLGLAGVAALAAGFAGVVIVFGLDSKSARFLEFRDHANVSLHGNWTSVIVSSFVAAGLGLAAAALVPGAGIVVPPWCFELGCLMVAHAAARMVWLLRVLMGVVKEDDRAEMGRMRTRRVSERLAGH